MKGVELAVTTIAVLVMSIVILGLAGGITYKLLCVSGHKIAELDGETERLVEQKLSSGALVTIPISSKEVKASADFCKGTTIAGASYALGIKNPFAEPKKIAIACMYKGYELDDGTIEYPPGVPNSGLPCNSQQIPLSVQYDSTYSDGKVIGPKDSVHSLIAVNAQEKAPLGKHIFTLSVCFHDVTEVVNPNDCAYNSVGIDSSGVQQSIFLGAANFYFTMNK